MSESMGHESVEITLRNYGRRGTGAAGGEVSGDVEALAEDDTAENDAPTMGQWAHDVAAQYRTQAASEGWDVRRDALTRAADEYDAIGRRMDRITRVIPPASTALPGGLGGEGARP